MKDTLKDYRFQVINANHHLESIMQIILAADDRSNRVGGGDGTQDRPSSAKC